MISSAESGRISDHFKSGNIGDFSDSSSSKPDEDSNFGMELEFSSTVITFISLEVGYMRDIKSDLVESSVVERTQSLSTKFISPASSPSFPKSIDSSSV